MFKVSNDCLSCFAVAILFAGFSSSVAIIISSSFGGIDLLKFSLEDIFFRAISDRLVFHKR